MSNANKSAKQHIPSSNENNEPENKIGGSNFADLEQGLGLFKPFQKKVRTSKGKDSIENKQNTGTKEVSIAKEKTPVKAEISVPSLKKVKKTDSMKEEAAQDKKTTNNGKSKPKKDLQKKEAKKETKKEKKTGKSKPTINKGKIEPVNMDEDLGEGLPFDEKEVSNSKTFVYPSWIEEGNIKDKQGRRPGEEGYDPTTLYVPPEVFEGMNALWKEYWTAKIDHFDKIVVTKRWTFNHLLYDDALIMHREFNCRLLNWLSTPVVSFKDGKLARLIPLLLNRGYKLALMQEVGRSFESRVDDELIEREICQIHTRGTSIDGQELDYSSRFLLSIYQESSNFGITLCDTTTQVFYIGQFKDDPTRSHLRTILTKTKPVEVIYMTNFLDSDTINMLKGLSSKPSLTSAGMDKPCHLNEIVHKWARLFSDKDSSRLQLPALLESISKSVESDIHLSNTDGAKEAQLFQYERTLPFFFTSQALEICMEYLDNVLLADIVIPIGSYHPLELAIDTKGSLYLDSQALETLEIFEVNYLTSTSEQHSLFGYMNKTVTAFGKRMLKRWVNGPLINTTQIQARQEAVKDLLNNIEVVKVLQEKLSKLCDFEREIGSIYSYVNRKNRLSVNFEQSAKSKLVTFIKLLIELRSVEDIIQDFSCRTTGFQSKRLIELTSFNDATVSFQKIKGRNIKPSDAIAGIFPRLANIVGGLESRVEYKEGKYTPLPGTNADLDAVMDKINEQKSILEEYLEKQRRIFKNAKDVNYATSRHRYELEVPEDLASGPERSKEYTLVSKRKGFLRFHTPTIEATLPKLVKYEEEYKKLLIPFICDYFEKFYQNHAVWQQVISCLGELDCLCSLAILAASMDTRCIPQVFPQSNEQSIFELKDMVHPLLSNNRIDFVPNDVIASKAANIFLITGPNMGGKSTLLRQTCLATIMAQIGSYVPAKSFKLTPVDRIFTRLGASDRLFEGKSTFYIELEETYNIVTQATKHSLLIIDELGRGTSTYDGLAIAYGTLKYIAEKIKCLTLFATHYHLLLEEFQSYKNIRNYMMASEFNKERNDIKFLYKFVKGQVDKSHGIMIAKVAGLPDSVTKYARSKAEEINEEKDNLMRKKNLDSKFVKSILTIRNIKNEDDFNIEKILSQLETS